MKNTNPFPGLRAFGVEESHLFFGRESATDELLHKLRTHRFIAVVGTSGSGKSSLVKASMLPNLHGGMMTKAGSSWRVALFRPSNTSVRALAKALSHPAVFGSADVDSAIQIPAITETVLRRGAKGLVDVALQARMAPHENLLVVVDQFEELFRFNNSQMSVQAVDEAAAFVKLLLEACKQDDTPIYIVLTMRSEFMGDCTQFRDLPEAINAGQYLIPRMTRDQRKMAIIGPVAVSGTKMTPQLIQRLLNDVGDNPDQLPILQHAMMRTWDNWAQSQQLSEPLDIPHYEAIGGMTGALSRHADEAFYGLPDNKHRQLAEKIFKRLTEKGVDNRELRFPTVVDELGAITGATEQQVMLVIDAFRKEERCFLMPPPEEILTNKTLIDISHESLIRVWHRLQDWVNEEANSARIYKRLAETSMLHKNKEAGLWRDPDLQIALQWYQRDDPTAVWAQRYHAGFIDAIAFLNESKLAASRRRMMRLIPVALVPVLIFGVGIYNIMQKWRAEEQAKVALQEEVDARVVEYNLLDDSKQAQEKTLQVQVKLVKEMAEREEQGKDVQKLKTKLFATVNKEVVVNREQKRADTLKGEKLVANVAGAAHAMIRSEQDFVTCEGVVQLEPIGVSNEFTPGKVYVFARVYAPQEESLTLKLYTSDGKELWEYQMKVLQNLATGFRTYAFKTLFEPGHYEFRLFNKEYVEMGYRKFEIIEAQQL